MGNLDAKNKLRDALDVVGEVFADVKSACLEGHFQIETNRLEETKEIIRCIKMYAILKGIDKLSGRKLDVLAYYLISGYNRKTKKDIIKRVKITDSNLNNINHELRKMGVIEKSGYNQATNEVNSDLLAFKNFIVDNRGKYALIKID